MKVLVTGATGFVGGAVVRHLAGRAGMEVIATSRRDTSSIAADVEIRRVGDLGSNTDWSSALEGVDVVVHAAARAHVMDASGSSELEKYREANVFGTKRLIEQCVDAGVRRFVFISSIKVNGERTFPGRPLTPASEPNPVDPYGISKHEAEQLVRDIAEDGDIEWVIIRPVLVYGPGVKANFLRMVRMVASRLPLPLGGIRNRRSMVYVENLVDLIAACADHPRAPGNVFFVSDNDDLSTSEMLQLMGRSLGVRPLLFRVPASALRLLGSITGRRSSIERLLESLEVDISETLRILDWQPRYSVSEGFRATAEASSAEMRSP